MPTDPETGNPLSERDITKYGASIQRATVAPGTLYWKIVDAYHLSGQQNKGNHNLYMDMLKEDGITRADGAHCNLYFADRTAVLTIDKPPNEAGTNAPMFRGNFYDVDGADGLPSDKAIHFNTEWPDEEVGNTDGHHSFMVIFQKTVAAGSVTTGMIRGTLVNGGGRSITLSGNGVSVTAQIGADGNFGFDNVAPSTYTLAVVGTSVTTSVAVEAGKTTHVALSVPTPGGGGEIETLQKQIAALQAQLAQVGADRNRLNAIMTQIKQVIQNAGV